ncbi:Glu/Leu/Phe/Val dehydrogenase dimerization domain-containing protein [Amycolatopsis pigmentata]|uniref:Glu/Leu/Phe/Val dehydrogenase dimerization domain-containing protein n=1 Tax=Amycolatopsis pigmentata TaxID=450801 RepID=A0ABW5FW93_9PSEU
MNRTDLPPSLDEYEHEELRVVRGPRSGITIAVAVHSTSRGPAIGGCRLKPYSSVGEAVADVLRLSRAMTLKCALADLPHGGGKTVAVVPGSPMNPHAREELILDIADTIGQLGGRYITGPDIGTTPEDMALIHRRTPGGAFCRPETLGGSGNSSAATARGVRAALDAAVGHVHHADSVAGLRIGVIGFGSVGRLLSESLAADGANVIITDVNDRLRSSALDRGIAWTGADLLREDLDVLVPAATGGLLDADAATACRARLVVGPANNQLASDDIDARLRERGITWVPDVIAGAGGIIHAVCREELACDEQETNARIDAIGAKVTRILTHADTHEITTLQAADAVIAHPEPTPARWPWSTHRP